MADKSHVESMELAWGLIANAWDNQNKEWVAAAERWRDENWHPLLEKPEAAEAEKLLVSQHYKGKARPFGPPDAMVLGSPPDDKGTIRVEYDDSYIEFDLADCSRLRIGVLPDKDD